MGKIRFGIIGTGIGANFCANGLALIATEGLTELTAVASQRMERAKEFADKWGLKYWYTDYRRMLREAPVDAVIINTPHHQHYPMALDAIDSD
ncbi:MAG: Gfo/Idh/MocA family oxidoreductase, partial [Candidatus Bathyarchaeia archaeon]